MLLLIIYVIIHYLYALRYYRNTVRPITWILHFARPRLRDILYPRY